MIGISTLLYDTNGHQVIPDRNLVTRERSAMSRRASSTKTLDGSAFVSDFGFSVNDNEILVTATGLSESVVDKFKDMIRFHSRFWVCNTDGAFECILSSLAYANNELDLTFLVVASA